MKKITNKFKPRDCVYRLGKRVYLSQPKNTVIKYYVQDDNESYIGVLRRQYPVLPILALIVVICTIIFKINHQSIDNDVNVPTMMYLTDGMLSLDLDNESDYDILYDVRVDNISISNGIVKANSSRSNVNCDFVTEKEVISGVLLISYDNHVKKFDISLTVKSDL